MEKLPVFMETKMTDASLARDLVIEIAGHCWNGKGDMLERVYQSVSKYHKNWTRRRIRAIYHREVAGVRFHEMCELAGVAVIDRQHQDELKETKIAHRKFIERTAHLRSLLERQDEAFHRHSIEGMGCMAGGMDRAGTN